MHRVLILGAGKIGALISGLLAESGSYRVSLADVNGQAAESVDYLARLAEQLQASVAAFRLGDTEARPLPAVDSRQSAA